MKQNDTQPDRTPDEALAPLDAFEQQWVDQLAQRETDLAQTEQAFIQSVIQQAEAASAAGAVTTSVASPVAKSLTAHPPAVLARIGKSALPFAVAAAALLLAALLGYSVLTDSTSNTPNEQSIAEQPDTRLQPNDQPAVATNDRPNDLPTDRPKVQLGKLIASVKTTATSPANNLTAAVSEVPDTLNIDRLFDLLDGSVPDLNKILAPLQPKDEQSRA